MGTNLPGEFRFHDTDAVVNDYIRIPSPSGTGHDGDMPLAF